MVASKPYSGIGRWHMKSVDTFTRNSERRITDLLEGGWEPFAVSQGTYDGVGYHFRKFILEDDEED